MPISLMENKIDNGSFPSLIFPFVKLSYFWDIFEQVGFNQVLKFLKMLLIGRRSVLVLIGVVRITVMFTVIILKKELIQSAMLMEIVVLNLI